MKGTRKKEPTLKGALKFDGFSHTGLGSGTASGFAPTWREEGRQRGRKLWTVGESLEEAGASRRGQRIYLQELGFWSRPKVPGPLKL